MSDADELPEGWASCSVLDLCHAVRGVSYSKGEASRTPEKALVPIVRANNIDGELTFEDLQFVPQARVSKDQRLRVGDVVIAMSSGSKSVVGKAASVTKPWTGAFGAFCGVLRPCSEIEARHFGLFFQTVAYRKTISDASAGTNINNLKREHFAAISFPIPPLAEQQRIVAKVEALLARVNAARQRLAKAPAILKRFRQSVLAAACADYPIVPLGDAIHELKYGTATKCDYDARNTPVLRIPNIANGVVDQTDLKFGNLGADERNTLSLRAGDILLIRSNGSVSLVGKPALVSEKQNGFAFAGYLMRLRLNLARALPAYVSHVLASPNLREQIEMPARSTSGVHNINTTDVKALLIPLPPLPEQHEIVRRVEALFQLADAIEKRVAAATVRAEKLTQAILAKAFRGELVPTEAELARREGRAYEPASALLERVKKSTDWTDSTDSKKRKKRRTPHQKTEPR